MDGSVRGYVTDRSGKPVSGATIVMSGSGPFPDIAPVTDEQGRFVLDGIAPGSYRCRAIGPTGESGEVSMSIETDAVTRVNIIVG